jgi:UDP-N-acetylglucosamine transferase subunit ALG13
MIFLTVGTQFAFDRLVKAVDQVVHAAELGEEIFAQIGDGSYRPRSFEAVTHLDKDRFDDCMQKASAIISHAGMGTITMALDHRKSLLVMPRRKKYGEVVNDHQVAIAKKYEELGHLLVAYDESGFLEKLRQLKDFVPLEREAQCEAVIERISSYLQQIQR